MDVAVSKEDSKLIAFVLGARIRQLENASVLDFAEEREALKLEISQLHRLVKLFKGN